MANPKLMTDNELNLRRLLWLRHGCPIHTLYGDDGEMRCSRCGIDFKRDSVSHIEVNLSKRACKELLTRGFRIPTDLKYPSADAITGDKLNDPIVQKESTLCKIHAELERSAYDNVGNHPRITHRINKLYVLMTQLVEHLINQD